MTGQEKKRMLLKKKNKPEWVKKTTRLLDKKTVSHMVQETDKERKDGCKTNLVAGGCKIDDKHKEYKAVLKRQQKADEANAADIIIDGLSAQMKKELTKKGLNQAFEMWDYISKQFGEKGSSFSETQDLLEKLRSSSPADVAHKGDIALWLTYMRDTFLDLTALDVDS
jgi:hypothetical protein